jgi:hypothetical protein
MANTTESDDAFVTGVSAMHPADRIDALLDVVSDTAQWQPAPQIDVDGRARS